MRFFLLAALVLFAVPVQAQVSFSPFIGYDLEVEDPLIGLAVEVGAPLVGVPLTPSVRPLVEYIFAGEGVDVIRANADLIGRLDVPAAPVGPYAKAGLVLTYVSTDVPDNLPPGVEVDNSTTDLGLNIGGGAEFSSFFGELEYGFGDFDGFRVRAGYRF